MSDNTLLKRVLLRIWRDVPFTDGMRFVMLRILNPAFMVGVMALIQDEQGRILVLEHTYRKDFPWGLPGGWLKQTESLETGLAREVMEETGYAVKVEALLGALLFEGSQLDLMYRCSIVGGSYQPTEETASHAWVNPTDLPDLLPNQRILLRQVGIVGQTDQAA